MCQIVQREAVDQRDFYVYDFYTPFLFLCILWIVTPYMHWSELLWHVVVIKIVLLVVAILLVSAAHAVARVELLPRPIRVAVLLPKQSAVLLAPAIPRKIRNLFVAARPIRLGVYPVHAIVHKLLL